MIGVRGAAVAGGAALAAAVLSAALPAGSSGGSPDVGAAPGALFATPDPQDLPFRVGEEAVYRVSVSLGPAPPQPVGSARLAVEARDTVEGREAFRVVREMEARVPLVYSVDDRQVSWFAPDPFRSLRFEEHLRQGDYRRHRQYRLDHAEGRYTRRDRSEDGGWRRVEDGGGPMPAGAMDEVAFLYFVRTLPLEVGEVRRFGRMFEADDNPVVLEVLRRDTVRVPAGTFPTVVVRPVIPADGLFSREGRAEVHLTDDDRRLVVRIESRMRAGRVDLSLEEYRPSVRPAIWPAHAMRAREAGLIRGVRSGGATPPPGEPPPGGRV